MDELRKRKAGLEHAAIMMASEGVAVPPELSDELAQLVKSLAELSETSIAQKTWTSFLGEEIEGYVLNERISSGTYAHVFKAVHETTGETCAIKISRTNVPITVNPDDYFSKQAIRFHLELCQYVDVSPNEALNHECERLLNDRTGHFVEVLSSGLHKDLFYYRMPFLDGSSLKAFGELWQDFNHFSDVNIEVFQKLCSVLDDFFLSTPAQYHGNLRPDSVFITKTRIVLLSPGTFEIPDLSNNEQPKFMITTPAYYPFFEPNDLFALGVSLWENLCREHPFDAAARQERINLFAPELREMLEYRKALSHSPLWQTLKLRLPRDARNELSSEAETTLLKALKLEMNSDGLLTAAQGFASALEFSQSLEQLIQRGWVRAEDQ